MFLKIVSLVFDEVGGAWAYNAPAYARKINAKHLITLLINNNSALPSHDINVLIISKIPNYNERCRVKVVLKDFTKSFYSG